MISVLIRNKNQAKVLESLLINLTTRYTSDISEIVVIDNESSDDSLSVCKKYGARFETIHSFSYGGSANFAADKARFEYVVMFSAHSYPVSPDFFSTIEKLFKEDDLIAGLRCLHNHNDYRNYIEGISAKDDPNKSGLIFSGSAFRKSVWEEYKFDETVPTFEDKELTLRIIKTKYKIQFAPVVFNYHIVRSRVQLYFRFKNDLHGNHVIWGEQPTYSNVFKALLGSVYRSFKNLPLDIYYGFKRFFYSLFFLNKFTNKH